MTGARRRAVGLGLILGACGCVPRARLCAGPSECAPQGSCVAGRCVANVGIAEIQRAERLVLEPVARAWLRRGKPTAGRLAVLGRDADSDSTLLFRFSATLPRDARVVEAYLLLERSDAVDMGPDPVELHALRIAEPWDERNGWPFVPRLEDLRSPMTRATTSGPRVVRLDVTQIVRRWPTLDARDQGLAVVADVATPTGIAFVMEPLSETSLGPRLELYLR